MSYDYLSNTVCTPVFLPDSLLKLNVSMELMVEAIRTFNEQVKKEAMDFKDEKKLVARVEELVRDGDDLFLRIRGFSSEAYKLDDLAAKLVGYVVMNKDTGAIADLVIEGFQFVRKKSLTSPQKWV